jgi:hypothetical protein
MNARPFISLRFQFIRRLTRGCKEPFSPDRHCRKPDSDGASMRFATAALRDVAGSGGPSRFIPYAPGRRSMKAPAALPRITDNERAEGSE